MVGLMTDWIFAHRGDWHPDLVPNSSQALTNAFTNGFAIETDVRDFHGKLVVSHDPCIDSNAQLFEELFGENQRIAINIKSDGLSESIVRNLDLIVASESFIFDCSFPELLRYKKLGIPHAMRISEYEKELPWTPDYIWLDAFESDWWLEDLTAHELIKRIPSIIVSPELHKRNHHQVWDKAKSLRQSGIEVSICTDFPNQLAEEFK
jgi:glycerophosphoryl diester phosphodiesterase